MTPTPDALATHAHPYRGRVVRMVEAQHRISTNRLADGAGEQALLEALADEVKPLLPIAAQRLPWLLAAPFRYGLGRPSRFRSADTLPGIFYAAEDVETAVSETAYWGAPQGLSYGQRQSEQMVNKSLSVAAKYIKFRGFVRLDELEVTGSPLVMFHPRSS